MKQSDFAIATQDERKNHISRPYDEIPQTALLENAHSHLLTGEQIMVSFLTMKAGSEFDLHTHVNEQVMIVLEGWCDQIIDGKIYHVEKGDVLYMPSGVVHGSILGDSDCKVIDIFTPVRDDYKEKFHTQNPGKKLPFQDSY